MSHHEGNAQVWCCPADGPLHSHLNSAFSVSDLTRVLPSSLAPGAHYSPSKSQPLQMRPNSSLFLARGQIKTTRMLLPNKMRKEKMYMFSVSTVGPTVFKCMTNLLMGLMSRMHTQLCRILSDGCDPWESGWGQVLPHFLLQGSPLSLQSSKLTASGEPCSSTQRTEPPYETPFH